MRNSLQTIKSMKDGVIRVSNNKTRPSSNDKPRNENENTSEKKLAFNSFHKNTYSKK